MEPEAPCSSSITAAPRLVALAPTQGKLLRVSLCSSGTYIPQSLPGRVVGGYGRSASTGNFTRIVASPPRIHIQYAVPALRGTSPPGFAVGRRLYYDSRRHASMQTVLSDSDSDSFRVIDITVGNARVEGARHPRLQHIDHSCDSRCCQAGQT